VWDRYVSTIIHRGNDGVKMIPTSGPIHRTVRPRSSVSVRKRIFKWKHKPTLRLLSHDQHYQRSSHTADGASVIWSVQNIVNVRIVRRWTRRTCELPRTAVSTCLCWFNTFIIDEKLPARLPASVDQHCYRYPKHCRLEYRSGEEQPEARWFMSGRHGEHRWRR
jgi:hypothetical protein